MSESILTQRASMIYFYIFLKQTHDGDILVSKRILGGSLVFSSVFELKMNYPNLCKSENQKEQ